MSNLLTKSFEFEFKEMDAEGSFTGHASTFGNKDAGDDIVVAGAFAKDLKRTHGGKIPILADHNIRNQIGWNKEAVEDKKGLAVKGELDLNVQAAREKHSLTKKAKELGAKMGLSIGYEAMKKDFDGPVRLLKEVKLHEYSFTAFPMNVRASVGNMKGVEMCVDNPFNSLVISMSEEIGVISEEKIEEISAILINAIKERGELKVVETDADIRIALKPVTEFITASLESTELLSKDKPVVVITGRQKVRGASDDEVTAQGLRFSKADSWTAEEALEWARGYDFKALDCDDLKKSVIYIPESIFTSPREMERSLRDVGGLSISRAKAVASEAFAGLRDVEGDDEAIKAILKSINDTRHILTQ